MAWYGCFSGCFKNPSDQKHKDPFDYQFIESINTEKGMKTSSIWSLYAEANRVWVGVVSWIMLVGGRSN